MIIPPYLFYIYHTLQLLILKFWIKNTSKFTVFVFLIQVNNYFNFKGEKALDKKHPIVVKIKEWVDKEYENGRVTCISDTELAKLATAEYDKYKKGMEE